MNPNIEKYMREYDELKRIVLDSPLPDEEVAVEIFKAYPLQDIVFARWLVRELRSAKREQITALTRITETLSELAVHKAMNTNCR